MSVLAAAGWSSVLHDVEDIEREFVNGGGQTRRDAENQLWLFFLKSTVSSRTNMFNGRVEDRGRGSLDFSEKLESKLELITVVTRRA